MNEAKKIRILCLIHLMGFETQSIFGQVLIADGAGSV